MNKLVKLSRQGLLVIVLSVSIVGICSAGSSRDYSGYPIHFDDSGKIDIFTGGKYMTINDISFEITKDTKFNRPGNLNCSKDWFKKNDLVYYLLEPDTRKIESLWFAKDKYMGRGKP